MLPKNRQSKSVLFSLLNILVVLALALSACGGQGSEPLDAGAIATSESPAGDLGAEIPEAPAVDEEAVDVTEEQPADTETGSETAEDVGEEPPAAGEEGADVITETQPADTSEMAETTSGSVQVSQLFASPVYNLQGEALGQIEDVLIGLNAEQANYVILAYDPLLSVGGMLSAVPLNAFQFSPADSQLVLDVDQTTLEDAPVFEANAWPDVNDPAWDDEALSFWETVGEGDGEAMGPLVEQAGATFREATASAIRTSDLLGYELQDSAGQPIGAVDDILIDLSTNRINFLIMAINDEFGLDHQFYAVPPHQFSIDTTQGLVVFNADPAMLMEAPGFDQDTWPDLSMPDWGVEAHDFWESMRSSP